jgi:hypothetical protein
MKKTLPFIFLLISSSAIAQAKIDTKDLSNLILISKLYSENPNATGDKFSRSIDSLRTPALNHIAEALIAIGKGDKMILEKRFLFRPDNDELMLWYVIREIHYNRVNKTKSPLPDSVVANEVLSQKIDERWLLDNYYYRIHGGIAMLFNEADLKNYNFNTDSLGFKDQTEKAIFFLSMMNALVGGRFKVLQMMKNNEKILEFCQKLPKFNGRDYFYFKNFDYDDFDWPGYEKKESYNERNIGNLYSTLMAQFVATSALKDKKSAQEIYFNSILHEPKYFKFSSLKKDLQSVYDKSNN